SGASTTHEYAATGYGRSSETDGRLFGYALDAASSRATIAVRSGIDNRDRAFSEFRAANTVVSRSPGEAVDSIRCNWDSYNLDKSTCGIYSCFGNGNHLSTGPASTSNQNASQN